MPLTLLTGPANAAKAGVAFERLRAWLPRSPLLVVPTSADVDHYQRELTGSGIVFSVEVVTFARLMALVAERAGVTGRPLGPVARQRVVRAAVAEVALDRLAASAASAGFAQAAGDLFAELQRTLITPARLESAVRAWGREEPGAGRVAQAGEVAALYRAYRRRLQAMGAHDREGFAWAALDALRRHPARWGGRPVVFYGFDDLTATEHDAVETLVRHASTDVLVALPYEPGRIAFAGRATTVALLAPLSAEHIALPERSEHYAPAARPALHHLERFLFEPGAPVSAGGAGLRLLEAGGERAEAELVAAEVLALLERGMPYEEVAVLVRGGSPGRDLLAGVLAGHGLPVVEDRHTPLARTRLGAGILALARAAVGEGTAQDVLRWLRTPGCLASPDAADRLEVALRRERASSVAAARRRWTGPPAALQAIDAVAGAAAAGPGPLLDALLEVAEATWMAPHRRRAAVLGEEAAADARVTVQLRAAIGELQHLIVADPALVLDCSTALEALAAVPVSERRSQTGVLIADPLEIRARRFRAVFATGLQEGEFPQRPTPDPFLDDDDRRALARTGGLRLALRDEAMTGERYLFYAICSRPQELLALSWRSSTEEGDPLQPSPFLQDVRVLFGDSQWRRRRRRLLADITWRQAEAPTALERRRARAAGRRAPEPPPLASPASAPVLEALAGREREPARGLETFASCGVRWLVESLLRPQRIDPDPEPLWRGSLAHAVLERTLRGLAERTGSARLVAERLEPALEALAAAVREREGSAREVFERAALRAVHADLARYLRQECEQGAGLEPRLLEWSFGGQADQEPPLVLADGTRVSGRIDRVDAEGGVALVRDYKHRTAHAGARWSEERRLQAGLYALAVRELLGLEPHAALYQPLSGPDLRPRGVVRSGTPGGYVRSDVLDGEGFERSLTEVAELAAEAAAGIRGGSIRPCPARCSPRGCVYPGICRSGEVDSAEEPG